MLVYFYTNKSLNSELYLFLIIAPTVPLPNQPAILHVSKSRPHPNYVFDHFPEFPDPHTYIHTETEVTNDKEYQKSRETIAQQRLNIERALVKYKIRSNPKESSSIFNDDPLKEPTLSLIENKINYNSHVNALLQSSTIDV